MLGKVKWFNPEKGYGFILPDDGSKELFVHFSAIQTDGYRVLTEGDEVDFQSEVDNKGKPQAIKVHVLKSQAKERHPLDEVKTLLQRATRLLKEYQGAERREGNHS